MSESQTFYNAAPDAQTNSSSHSLYHPVDPGRRPCRVLDRLHVLPKASRWPGAADHAAHRRGQGYGRVPGEREQAMPLRVCRVVRPLPGLQGRLRRFAKIEGVEIAKYDGGKGEQSLMELLMKKVGKIEGFHAFSA